MAWKTGKGGAGRGDGPSKGDNPQDRSRGGKVRVKTARGRKISSTRWLQRQLNDPYVAEAKRLGYRSRAAFKILELDEKYSLFKGVGRVVDLGSAPGGWTQVAVQKTNGAEILGLDLQEVEPVQGATIIQMDFMDEDAEERIMALLRGPVDLVMSDMANASIGHKQTDHLRTMALCEAAVEFAVNVLKPGGTFVSKVLQGGTDKELLTRLQQSFRKVRHAKPPSSRKGSTEWFVVAEGFKGEE